MITERTSTVLAQIAIEKDLMTMRSECLDHGTHNEAAIQRKTEKKPFGWRALASLCRAYFEGLDSGEWLDIVTGLLLQRQHSPGFSRASDGPRVQDSSGVVGQSIPPACVWRCGRLERDVEGPMAGAKSARCGRQRH